VEGVTGRAIFAASGVTLRESARRRANSAGLATLAAAEGEGEAAVIGRATSAASGAILRASARRNSVGKAKKAGRGGGRVACIWRCRGDKCWNRRDGHRKDHMVHDRALIDPSPTTVESAANWRGNGGEEWRGGEGSCKAREERSRSGGKSAGQSAGEAGKLRRA